MLKRSILALSLALTWLSASATNYYVVVPVVGKKVSSAAISVALSGAALPTGTVGQAYAGFDFKTLLSVSGDPTYTGYGLSWSVVSGTLPAGLTLSRDGVLGGTPTSSGTSSFQLQASYKTKTGQQSFQVMVGAVTIGLASSSLPQAVVGQAYSYDLKPLLSVAGDNSYNGAGVTWSVVSSTLPTGLVLRADGTIGGTPTAGGAGAVTARASYKGSNGEQTYQIVSIAISVSLAVGSPPQAIVGQAYSYDLKPLLSVTGDTLYAASAVSWSVMSGALPLGLALHSDGTISGTPNAASTSDITLRAAYRNAYGEQTYHLVALNIVATLQNTPPPNAIPGQAYSYDLKPLLLVSGDPSYSAANVTWTYSSNTLPAGLAPTAGGLIAGTATAMGTGSVVAQATYRGVSAQQTYSVTAGDALTVVTGSKAPLGAQGSRIVSGSVDDGSTPFTVPFSMKWFGSSYTGAFVGSNTYITFGSGSSAYSGLSLTNPALPGIMFGAADNSYQQVYQVNGTLHGVAFTRIRYEGTASTGGTVGAPTIVVEVTFFAPQTTRQVVEVVVGAHARNGGVFGVSNSTGAGTVSGGTITPNTSYVFQSDANGANWKITSGAHIE